jgi:hypothetical protein
MDSKKVRKAGEAKKYYKREIDTNICNIKFSVLQDQGALSSGDPIFCKDCQSVFNVYSKIELENKGEGEEPK